MIDPAVLDYFSTLIGRWQRQLGRAPAPRSIYKELLLPVRRASPDLTWMAQSQHARGVVEPATRKLLEPIQRAYFPGNHSVLEVGAGVLHSGRSYLSGLFGHLGTVTWTYSDTGELAKRADYLELDLTGGKPPARAFDRCVGSNVFDTLPYEDFAAALRTIRALLAPGGVFLHYADLNFYTNPFLDACADADSALLPTTAPHKTVHKISKIDYRRVLATAKLAAPEAAFFRSWATLPAQVQAAIIGDAFLTKVDVTALCARIETVFAGCLRPLHQINVFQRALVQGAAAAGLSVLECGFRIAEVTIPKRPPLDRPLDRHELDEGTLYGRRDAALAPGTEALKTKAHVFLAARAPAA